jgi:hypothetical protein
MYNHKEAKQKKRKIYEKRRKKFKEKKTFFAVLFGCLINCRIPYVRQTLVRGPRPKPDRSVQLVGTVWCERIRLWIFFR